MAATEEVDVCLFSDSIGLVSSVIDGGEDVVVVATVVLFLTDPFDLDLPPRIAPNPCPSTIERKHMTERRAIVCAIGVVFVSINRRCKVTNSENRDLKQNGELKQDKNKKTMVAADALNTRGKGGA